ncbi:MAG: 50S ribosomal protein L32 [Acidobacteria bacterium]|nr:50S ribosomal protein L32 [Acidobacteriota bacterium]
MAVPKKKKSKAKTHSRKSANMRMELPSRSVCPRCGAAKKPHVVCGGCGWYKGRTAVEVA